MSRPKPSLSPVLRSLAGLMLAAFVSAQFLCLWHCNLGDRPGKGRQASCHAASGGHCGKRGSSGSDSMPATTCLMFKGAVSNEASAPPVLPHTALLYALEPTIFSVASLDLVLSSFDWRDGWPDRPGLTPEVSIGQPRLGLAPPCLPG